MGKGVWASIDFTEIFLEGCCQNIVPQEINMSATIYLNIFFNIQITYHLFCSHICAWTVFLFFRADTPDCLEDCLESWGGSVNSLEPRDLESDVAIYAWSSYQLHRGLIALTWKELHSHSSAEENQSCSVASSAKWFVWLHSKIYVWAGCLSLCLQVFALVSLTVPTLGRGTWGCQGSVKHFSVHGEGYCLCSTSSLGCKWVSA